ncbi:MAG: amidase [Microvirga sp.]
MNDILALDGASLLAAFRNRALSPVEVVDAVLAGIERHNPVVNAFNIVDAEGARTAARRSEARWAKRAPLGPVDGLPLTIKDNIIWAGHPARRGSRTSSTDPVAESAPSVDRLLEAGAVPIGKTTLPEFGWKGIGDSPLTGITRNPWDTRVTTGGSSAGAAAAAVLNLGVLHLGTDGAGSIRIPAAFCGLFGLKPTRGRIPLGPRFEDAWHGLSVLGPLARTVADAALFLDVTADGAPPGGFAGAVAAGPGRLRIGVSTALVPGTLARLGADQRRAVAETADLLRSLGHEVRDVEVDYGPRAFPSLSARYLRGIHDDAASLPRPERLERRTRSMARLGGLVPAGTVARLRRDEPALAARIDRVFDGVDVLLQPGPSGPPFRIGALHGRGALWTLNAAAAKVPWYGVWNAVGHPAASVPAGFDRHGLPLAVQLVGPDDADARLLALGGQLEAARPWADRRPPVG